MPRGRPRGFDRDEAVARAVPVFWEYGYEGAAMSRLLEVMGISTASLYAAFGDKRGLFDAVVDRYMATDGAFPAVALADEPTALDAVTRLLGEAAKAYTGRGHPPGCLLNTAATNCAPQSADVRERLRGLRATGAAALERKIAADVARGALPADTDPAALAAFYSATLHGMSAQARDGVSRATLERIAAAALRAWPAA